MTGKFRLIGVQVLGASVMAVYSALVANIFFSILRQMNRFRIGDTVEIAGMDMLDDGFDLNTKLEGTEITKQQVLTLEMKQRKARLKYGLTVRIQ